MSMDTLVQTNELRKRFGRVDVLRGVTMAVPAVVNVVVA
jgi:ABC-type histidine transport system ATPase subunit